MLTVRPENPADVGPISALHASSFPTPNEARLVDALRSARRLCVSLVAVDDSAVVGHIAFSPVMLPSSSSAVGLGPVAVLPSHRKRGVAESLVRNGLQFCVQASVGFVVVLGDPRYYRKFGFLPARRWNLRDEYNGGDAFQALEIVVGAIPSAGGQVRYAAEFAAFGV